MKSFIVQVDLNPIGAAGEAYESGYGEEFVVAYLRQKMPAGSVLEIIDAKEANRPMPLTPDEQRVLLDGKPERVGTIRSLRDDDPAV